MDGWVGYGTFAVASCSAIFGGDVAGFGLWGGSGFDFLGFAWRGLVSCHYGFSL